MENYTIRSGTHDFLLTFHSNHRPISHRFRDKRRYPSKNRHFPTPVYFAPPLKELPLELGIDAGSQKTRIMALPSRENFLTISSAVWIQYTNVSDGRTYKQTDGQTPGDSKDRVYDFTHSVAR